MNMKTAMTGLLCAALLVSAPAGTREESAPLRRIADMNVARAAHQATLLDSGHVLVTGGCGEGCDAKHASAELFDPQSDTFAATASMATPRASHTATRLNDGRVLVAGGWADREVVNSAEIFDPATRRFTPADDMTAARAGHAAVRLPDGRVLLAGGESATNASLASTEIFDPATGTFSPGARMRTPRNSHVAVALADGRVLVAGGHSARGKILRSAEIFDPRNGKFVPTGDMKIARHKFAAIRLRNGKVLVVGGSDARDHDGRMRSTEIFDPESGRFAAGPDMRQARHKIEDALVMLPSGRVLVAGGAPHPEVYDPRAGKFTMSDGTFGGERMFATATRLGDGRVLILGGYDERIRTSNAAWLHAAGKK